MSTDPKKSARSTLHLKGKNSIVYDAAIYKKDSVSPEPRRVIESCRVCVCGIVTKNESVFCARCANNCYYRCPCGILTKRHTGVCLFCEYQC